jgi:hypothetical protein
MHRASPPALVALSAVLTLCVASRSEPPAEQPAPTQSKTLAYWRFEGDGKTAPDDGDFLTDTADRTGVFQARGVPALDSSGNGNTLYTWNANFTGHHYTVLVPAETVKQTGAANTRSIANRGAFPCTFTWSRESKPTGVDIEPVTPLAWTIEAFIRLSRFSGTSTFVGRDGTGVSKGILFVNGEKQREADFANWAPLYFETRAVNGKPHLSIQFTDMAGYTHRLVDSEPLPTDKWHHVAAVSDGETLSLYKDSGPGYTLVQSTSLAATGSSDRRLGYDTAGSISFEDEQWGWTIGRGRYGAQRGQYDDHSQRWYGCIDEVRISSGALLPDEFLFAEKLTL